MWLNTVKPRLCWISNKRNLDCEWVTYTKTVTIKQEIKSAVVRFETDCTLGLYAGDEFIAAGTGRNPERVNCHEITTKLSLGDNNINVVLGTAYFQKRGMDIAKFRGYYFSGFAMEIDIEYIDGTKEVIPTDASWTAEIGGKTVSAMETMPVTDGEYNAWWKNAVVWLEKSLHKAEIPDVVAEVTGKEYVEYANRKTPEYAYPEKVEKTNMILCDGKFVPDKNCPDKPYIIYDFVTTRVGFTEIAYSTDEDVKVTLGFDFRENIADFDHDMSCEWTPVIQALEICETLKKDETLYFNLRRRAARFIKLEFEKNAKIEINDVRVKQCLYPNMKEGWFDCSDEFLNTMWEMGKYTLHVNKQQEYESCPRNEMQFFSGDGLLDMIVDNYAFGEVKLMESSLSLNYSEACVGVTHTEDFNRSRHQWDYYAWRIICIYHYYKVTGNMEFLKTYFNQAETILLWHINRMGYNGLIFQPMCFLTAYTFTYAQVDWACALSRLGDKPYLNALFYKSLTAMSEMARAIGENGKADAWDEISAKVKDAINEKLWSEEKKSYVDSMADYISIDGNIIPLYFGVADDERTKAVLSTIKKELWTSCGSTILNCKTIDTRGGNVAVSPFMSTFEVEMRFLTGDNEGAMELLSRVWGSMMKRGAHTFWEYLPVEDGKWWDALCHAWSTGCTYLLSAYVLGIRMTKPNFTGIIFEPRMCGLDYIRGVIPTENGFIAAKCENGKCTIAVPDGTEVEVIVPDGTEVEVKKY